jgi:hypothetical protein
MYRVAFIYENNQLVYEYVEAHMSAVSPREFEFVQEVK